MGSIEQNNELYDAVVAGDPHARDEMIINNRGLVVVKSESLIRQIPSLAYLRDDLVCAGNIGLVEGVDGIVGGKVKMAAVNSWLGQAIVRAMLHYLPNEQTIRILAESRRCALIAGEPIDPPRIFNALPEVLEAASDYRVVELRDVFSACCRTENERLCFRLREAGHTYTEIAEKAGLAVSTVYGILKQLKQRILDAWNDND